uniref:Major facilitator superfamily domain containing 14A n=1 Tax=Cyanistes caeruleus TaxID=156563 RepID=A0A8C0VPF5_CYACU
DTVGNRYLKMAPMSSISPAGKPVINQPQGIGSPSVYHAVIVIFLEFFAWGLLTAPTLVVLHETFPKHTFLMNGLIQGVKGLLSFLSAPLIGALSDVWGRKSFLLLTVFFTCAPIPLMKISPWWYFAVISVSGVFAVTFSVVFAYVFSHQPCYRCLPWPSVWRQPGGGAGYSNSLVGHLFYPCCCSGIAAREDEASILGSTHFMGTG